jgi:hypothetical protein
MNKRNPRQEQSPEKICCICKRHYAGHGHSAAPVGSGLCCDECNATVVLPARIAAARSAI